MSSLIEILQSAYAGALAASSGFAGTCALIWASWRSINPRKHLHALAGAGTEDRTLRRAIDDMTKQLNLDQLTLIAGEKRWYLTGFVLLALSFFITLLPFLLILLQKSLA